MLQLEVVFLTSVLQVFLVVLVYQSHVLWHIVADHTLPYGIMVNLNAILLEGLRDLGHLSHLIPRGLLMPDFNLELFGLLFCLANRSSRQLGHQ